METIVLQACGHVWCVIIIEVQLSVLRKWLTDSLKIVDLNKFFYQSLFKGNENLPGDGANVQLCVKLIVNILIKILALF